MRRTQKQKRHAVKPIAMLRRMIAARSNPGNLIVDPFAGSGATAVACRQLRHHFLACDSQREYVLLARKDLASVTGQLFD